MTWLPGAMLASVLLDLIGPPNWRDLAIVEANLRLAVNDYPRLTLDCHVRGLDASAEDRIRRLFTLVPAAEPRGPIPLDLDALTQAARERLGRSIHKAAEMASWEVQLAFKTARQASAERHAAAVAAILCHRTRGARFKIPPGAGW